MGWMPGGAAEGEHWLVICTISGPLVVQFDAKGQPSKQVPAGRPGHEHAVCPFATVAHLADPTCDIVAPVPGASAGKRALNQRHSRGAGKVRFALRAPRGPPFLA